MAPCDRRRLPPPTAPPGRGPGGCQPPLRAPPAPHRARTRATVASGGRAVSRRRARTRDSSAGCGSAAAYGSWVDRGRRRAAGPQPGAAPGLRTALPALAQLAEDRLERVDHFVAADAALGERELQVERLGRRP